MMVWNVSIPYRCTVAIAFATARVAGTDVPVLPGGCGETGKGNGRAQAQPHSLASIANANVYSHGFIAEPLFKGRRTAIAQTGFSARPSAFIA